MFCFYIKHWIWYINLVFSFYRLVNSMERDFGGKIIIGGNSIPKWVPTPSSSGGGRSRIASDRSAKKNTHSGKNKTPPQNNKEVSEDNNTQEENSTVYAPSASTVLSSSDVRGIVHRAYLAKPALGFYGPNLGNIKIECEDADGLFSSYTTKIGKIETLDVSDCKSVRNLFRDCRNLEVVEKVILSPKTDCTNMFAGCKNLRIISFEIKVEEENVNFSEDPSERFGFLLDFATIGQTVRRTKTKLGNTFQKIKGNILGTHVLGYAELFRKFNIKANGMLWGTIVEGNPQMEDLGGIGAFDLDGSTPYKIDYAKDMLLNSSVVHEEDGVLKVRLTCFDVFFNKSGDEFKVDTVNPCSLEDVLKKHGKILNGTDKISVEFDFSDYFFWPKVLKNSKNPTLTGAFENTFKNCSTLTRIEYFNIGNVPSGKKINMSEVFVNCKNLEYIPAITGLKEYSIAMADNDVITYNSFAGCKGKILKNTRHWITLKWGFCPIFVCKLIIIVGSKQQTFIINININTNHIR